MRISTLVFALMVAFAMNASPALAKKDGGKGGEGDRPPGWDHGEKKGWGDADRPPGLAKKMDDAKKGKAKKEKKKKKSKSD